MGFQFKKASAVAVGTFNIYIIQPKWLVEIDVIEDGTKVMMETDLTRPGFRFDLPDQTKWSVRPDVITVESKNDDVDCGADLATVIDILKWTPIRAIGLNVEFKGDQQTIDDITEKCELPVCEAPEGYAMEQRTWHVALRRNEKVINVQLADGKDGIELGINVHTDVSKLAKQVDGNEMAVKSLSNFFPDLNEAVSLVESLLTTELNYANHSTK